MADKLLVALIVLAAAAYATWSLWLRRRWRMRQARAAAAAGLPVRAVGGCSNCEAAGPGIKRPS